VAGLSTELTDITEVEYRALRLERVVLIGVWTEGTLANAENSLTELSRLAETAGSVVLDGLIQRRSRVDAATYIGSGKARELAGRRSASAMVSRQVRICGSQVISCRNRPQNRVTASSGSSA